MSDKIIPILMPKWGLSMKEGILSTWHVDEGEIITPGQEIMDVETEKIANAIEASDGGLLRRRVGKIGETYTVKSLLGVIAAIGIPDTDIDSFIENYQSPIDSDEDTLNDDSTDHFVDTPSGRLQYNFGGTGDENILLIHGFGGDRNNWLLNTEAIGAKGIVYALDLPGHGGSTKSLDKPDMDGLCDAVIEFMDAADITAAHLVGHSMGGAIAGHLALRDTRRVKSLTLIDSAGLGTDINNAYIDGFVTASSRRDLKPVLQLLFADPSLVSRSMLDDLLKYKRLDGVTDTLAQLAAALFADGRQSLLATDQLAQLTIPIQIIWGEDDAIIPVGHAHAIPGAQVELIPGVGHMPQIEAAARVNQLICDLITP